MNAAGRKGPQPTFLAEIERRVRLLYTGRSRRAVRFRYALIAFDVATIVYFIVTTALPETAPIAVINVILGVAILADLGARLWIAESRRRVLLQIYTIADIIVVASLLFAPFLSHELAFLRILRGLRLLHSYHLMRDLRAESAFFRRHEDALLAAVNLFVFVFVTTSLVYVLGFDDEEGVAAYIDALYFTVATLTTTGFGDIVMTSPGGKLLSVFIMVVGVALFIQLARAVFQPAKVRYRCPGCGLSRHDPDAIHCKHCGTPLKIETKGASAE